MFKSEVTLTKLIVSVILVTIGLIYRAYSIPEIRILGLKFNKFIWSLLIIYGAVNIINYYRQNKSKKIKL